MDILPHGFSIQNTAQSVQKGFDTFTSSVGKGVQGVGDAVGIHPTHKGKPTSENAQSHQKPEQKIDDQGKGSVQPQAQGGKHTKSQVASR